LLAIRVAAVIRIIDPGTNAVSTPVAPITPTNQGSNVFTDSLNRARSMSGPESPRTWSVAAKPTKNTNSRMS
jgi:hypothetical protein